MANEDSNSIIREFLVNQVTLTDVVDERIYAPRLIEKAVLPAVSFLLEAEVLHHIFRG